MVLGESTAREFEDGDVILIEAHAPAQNGFYVPAQSDGQWLFRQLRREAQCWWLRPLNPQFERIAVTGQTLIRGVVFQKSRPGRRNAIRRYVA